MRKSALFLAAASLLTAGTLSNLHAQAQAPTQTQSTTTRTTTREREVQEPTSQTTTVQTTTQQVATAQTFTGKVVKKDKQFILENKEAKSSYKLDDAQKADHFEGKTVKVVGTLDNSTNMIHVETIDKAS